jgi:hypothetical protein
MMPKINLSQTYIHAGKFYGPGEVDVPEDVHKDLKAREDEAKEAAKKAEQAPPPSEEPEAEKPARKGA